MGMPTTIPHTRLPRGAVQTYVYVDDFDVQRLLLAVERAVSGPSLAVFLKGPVNQYLHEQIGLRFAYEGDKASGNWDPLSDATNSIRQTLGYPPVSPINVRTGEMEAWLTDPDSMDFTYGAWAAMLHIPGGAPTPLHEKKLDTAQKGSTSNPIPEFGPTPPRPVLAVDASDMATILEGLQVHIQTVIKFSM